MRGMLLAMTILVACGETPGEPVGAEAPVEPPPTLATEPVLSFAVVSERSGCAMRTLEELCAGLREHFGSFEGAWTSDACVYGPRATSAGPFAEALLLGVHTGSGRAEGDARVQRRLLGATLEDPASDDFTTNVLLAARVGEAWFPLHLFEPLVRADDVGAERFAWQLDADGRAIAWSDHEGSGERDDPDGYGRVERTVAVVVGGTPVIATQATVESWRSETDLACSRACYAEPSPPPPPGCSLRCASRVHVTRSWERSGMTLRIGASVVERSGPRADAMDVELDIARTVQLAEASADMRFCAFMPVVHATPREAPRTDTDSVALLAHARELVASQAGHDVSGAREAAEAGAPRSLVAIDAQLGGACGGGGCTIGLQYRTLDGPFPEDGVHFFQMQRGPQQGCDDTALPRGSAPTLVEVAPAARGASLGCGFSGWDGSAERTWVITRVLE